MRGAWTVTVVSDDDAWTEAVRMALHHRGVEPLALSELRFEPRAEAGLAILLDARLEPHQGAEVGAELRELLGDACPPVLLAARDAIRLTPEQAEAFAGVIVESDPAAIAARVARLLARSRASSAVFSRADTPGQASGTDR